MSSRQDALFGGWVLVGAGSAGLASALALTGRLGMAELTAGPVLVLDSHRPAQGASRHNPGRGQGGFHYPDRTTAEDLQDTLAHNLATYPDRFVAHLSRDQDGELGHSWYALLPAAPGDPAAPRSIIDHEESVEAFEHLSRRWDRIRREHPACEVLGDGPFMRWIPREEAEATLGTDLYASVALTLEPSIDVASFVDGLCTDVEADDRVRIIDHDRLVQIRRLEDQPDSARFLLETSHRGEPLSVRARNVNVCAWEATEALLAPLGYEFETLNRIKRGFRLKLGSASDRFPSTIAVFGSHAMVRNFYDGTGFATIGDITNVNTRRLSDTDGSLAALVAHVDDDREAHTAAALDALARYFPALDVEELTGVEFGVVKLFSHSGVIDLSDPRSEHHARRVKGFSHRLEDGLWVTWAMKLVSCFVAAEQFHASAGAISRE